MVVQSYDVSERDIVGAIRVASENHETALNGHPTFASISKVLDVPQQTIRTWATKHEQNGAVDISTSKLPFDTGTVKTVHLPDDENDEQMRERGRIVP